MADEWIIEVLDDLRSFARMNGLPALACELDQTIAVAFHELGHRVAQAKRGIADAEAPKSKGAKRL
ncbi:hypothetical protein [Actibacterium sp. D379-3]